MLDAMRAVLLALVMLMLAATPAGAEPSLPLEGRRICIDPGHDAKWAPGAVGRNYAGVVPVHPTDGVPLYEHELTLSVAYRLKALLEADGASVCVTQRPREEGGGNHVEPVDYTGDGLVRTSGVEDTPERTQPRIDWANDFGAEILVSIHFNGLDDRRVRGTEVYYTDGGPREASNRLLASSLLDELLAELLDGRLQTSPSTRRHASAVAPASPPVRMALPTFSPRPRSAISAFSPRARPSDGPGSSGWSRSWRATSDLAPTTVSARRRARSRSRSTSSP